MSHYVRTEVFTRNDIYHAVESARRGHIVTARRFANSVDPEGRAAMEAYVSGVNDVLNTLLEQFDLAGTSHGISVVAHQRITN